MKITAILILMVLVLASVGCETQADREGLENAKLQLQTTMQTQQNDLTDRVHETQAEGISLVQGEAAGLQISSCFRNGFDYPRRKNVDGELRLIDLSNRVIANCDRIMKIQIRYNAHQDTEEKRKDAAYDKAHPSAR